MVDLVDDGDADDGEGAAHESAWFDFGPQPRVPTSTRPMDNALALAEMAIVTNAVQCSRRDNTRIFVDLKPVEIEINGTAMKRLQFGGWLQDDHINGYMYLFNRAGPVNRLLAFSSFFMVKLMVDGGGYSYAGVRRWTKKVDIFAYAHLAIPYNASRSHWVLLHIDNVAKKVCCCDSYDGCHKREIGALVRYLQDEFSARHPGKRARYYTSTPDGKPVSRANFVYF